MEPRITISVWSDYVCPFCYLQEPVFERLKAEFGSRIEIERLAFELRPDPIPTLDPRGKYLKTTWDEHVYPMAEDRGMTLHLPPLQPRSRLAFEAERFAREQGRGPKMHQALFQAFFEQGLDIGSIDVLTDIGRAVNLNASRLQAALESGDYTADVAADRREAERLGITVVPAMRLHRTGTPPGAARLLTGALPYDALHDEVSELLARASA